MARGFLATLALAVSWCAESAWAANDHAAPPESPAAAPPRELLSQYVDFDRDDFKAKGKITLHRLQPLAGQLRLSEASGDPAWIFKTIAPWNPALASLLTALRIRELTLSDGNLLLDGKRVDLRLQKAAIPEGGLEDAVWRVGEDGRWEVSTGPLRLERLPSRLDRLLLSLTGTVGYRRMQAAGDAREGSGWAEEIFGEGWSASRLEGSGSREWNPPATRLHWHADRIVTRDRRALTKKLPVAGEILRFAGQDPAATEPLRFERAEVRGILAPDGSARIPELKLDAAWVKLNGNGKVDAEGMVTLELIATRPDGKQKRFKINHSKGESPGKGSSG
ncbi:MAG: hypothetical protein HQM02_08540 [Magnetococcales bacterium]|nr:hypothetical protein [Magnetococcales bacterium]